MKCKILVAQSCLTLCYHIDYSPPGSSVHGILQARILEWVAISFSRGSSWLRDRTWVSCITGRFFTIWATSESESRSVVPDSLQPHGLYSPWNSPAKNTGEGIHSFLQGIFLTQGSNPGLLHYRQILYHLSHQGSPSCYIKWIQMSIPPSWYSWLIWLKLGLLPSPGILKSGQIQMLGIIGAESGRSPNPGTAQILFLLWSRLLLSYSAPWASLASFIISIGQSWWPFIANKDTVIMHTGSA